MAQPEQFAQGLSIGIIMDGNGRWAKKRGLPRTAGHKKGAEVFQDITRYCNEMCIRDRFDSRHSDQKPLIERSMAFLCTLKSANLEKPAEWRTGGFAERWNRELYAFKIAQPGGTKQSFCIFVNEKVDLWQFNGV